MSGERKNGLRVLVSLGVVVGVLGLFAAPALAASETPEATEATEVTSTSARMNGVLNPGAKGEPGLYSFVHAAAPEPCEDSNQETAAVYDAGEMGEHVTAKLEGLLPATTYTYCLIAENSGEGERVFSSPETFTTPPAAPTVSEQAVVIVGASTATVSAEIGAGGLSTGYHVEFVTQAQWEASGWKEAGRVPATDAELPAMSTPVPVSEDLAGLAPNTAYRFRFVATNVLKNVLETVYGSEETLTTAGQNVVGGALPDERAYELVSVLGSGEPYYPPTPISLGQVAPESRSRLPFRAAANGEGVAYVAEPTAEGGTGEIGPGQGNQWLATRSPGGWEAQDITPEDNLESVYESFTGDLTTAFYEGGPDPLLPEVHAGCPALYRRTSETGSFSALFTAGKTPENCGHPLYAGSSSDSSQVIFQSEAALTPNSEEASEVPPAEHEERHGGGESEGKGCMFVCNLYDSVDGQLQLVNELNGKTVPNATFGGYAPGAALTDFSNAISSDGTRIFWTDTQSGPDMEHVYVRENGTTIPVSGSEAAEYWTATPDGHYAFYTEGGSLWRFDTEANEREQLTTAPGAEVQGVIGTSEDGAYVYIVADGKLATNSNPADPAETATEGAPNLYLIHTGPATFTTTFIGTLSTGDSRIDAFSEGLFAEASDWGANLGERLAEVSPDGRHLVFQSANALTGYDNLYDGAALEEVFVYSADDAQLACASCSPTGAPPVSGEGAHEALNHSKLPESAEADTFMRRWMSDSGSRVFFDSEQPLSPLDENGIQDVYEWERVGEGTCTAQAASRVTGGCTYLLSGGTSQTDSFLIDADAEGNNVFFEHVGPLGQVQAPIDHNELYDARVRGGFPQTSLACTGAGCQGVPPGPPIFATPASATFSGTGNLASSPAAAVKPKALTRAQKLANALKACGKKAKDKRAGCRAQAKKKFGAKTKKKIARKAGNERRAAS